VGYDALKWRPPPTYLGGSTPIKWRDTPLLHHPQVLRSSSLPFIHSFSPL